MPPACVVKTHAVEISEVAQFITVCGASNLVEARCISSPVQGSSSAKTWASSRPSRAHGHHLRPSTNCYKLSDAGYDRAKQHGVPAHIVVCNAGPAYAPAVALHAVTLLLALQRRIPTI